MSDATPRPWEHSEFDDRRVNASGTGNCVAYADVIEHGVAAGKANAALIVEAVNAHDALMAVYEAAKRQQGELLYGKHPTAWIPALCDAVDAVDAALPQQEPSQP